MIFNQIVLDLYHYHYFPSYSSVTHAIQFTFYEMMEMYGSNPGCSPGPVDDSVLHDQDKHVSSAVWEGQVR